MKKIVLMFALVISSMSCLAHIETRDLKLILNDSKVISYLKDNDLKVFIGLGTWAYQNCGPQCSFSPVLKFYKPGNLSHVREVTIDLEPVDGDFGNKGMKVTDVYEKNY